MKIITILILSILASCSSTSMPSRINKSQNGVLFSAEDRPNKESDETFKALISRFQKYKKTVDRYYHPNDVIIVFGNEFNEEYLSATTAACIYYEKNQREIRINEEKWDSFGPAQKEFTVYHYMVHCDLDNHEHNSAKTHQNIPISTMSHTIVDEQILKKNRAHYLKDIFKNY